MATSHHIETSIIIKGKLEDVYALAEDVERYPEFIPGYKGEVLSKEGNKSTLQRVVEIMGNQITWKSVATFQKNEWMIEFEQIEGPLKGMIAKWIFERVPEGTKSIIVHDFELERPILGWTIEKIIETVSAITRNTLEGLKKKLEA